MWSVAFSVISLEAPDLQVFKDQAELKIYTKVKN